MEAVTFLSSTTDVAAVLAEAVRAKQSAREKPKLVIVFSSPNGTPRMTGALGLELGVPVVGCTSGGTVFTERGEAKRGVAGAILGGDDLSVSVAAAKALSHGDSQSLREVIRSLGDERAPATTLLVFADAFSVGGDAVMAGLRKSTPAHWRCIGGLAGDDWKFVSTKAILNDQWMTHGAVLATLRTDSMPKMAVRHGFQRVAGATQFHVTSVDASSLLTLDDRPAAEAYREELKRLGLLQPGTDLVSVMARYPLGASSPFGEGIRIRTPLSVRRDGTLQMAGEFVRGETVQVVVGQDDDLVLAVESTIAELERDRRTRTAHLRLVVDCAGRRQLLGRRYADELKALGVGGNVPLLGFASYGEMARFGGSVEAFHNTTCAIAELS